MRLKSLCLLTGKPQEKLCPGGEEGNSVEKRDGSISKWAFRL